MLVWCHSGAIEREAFSIVIWPYLNPGAGIPVPQMGHIVCAPVCVPPKYHQSTEANKQIKYHLSHRLVPRRGSSPGAFATTMQIIVTR